MIWYVTTEPGRVCVPCVGVRDLGETERSHQHCIDLAFGKASISLTTCGHLTLAVASLGLPRIAGVSGCSVCLWAYK
jgi:hypothetical protein